MNDILGDLKRLRHYAAGLGDLLAELQRAAPERSEGADRSGTVRAVLGRDGLPETIRVSSLWKDRLTPWSFGGAVAEACEAAARERGTKWSQVLAKAGWQERMDRLETDSAAAAAADPSPVPAAFRRGTEDIKPRPLDVLAEEAISALDAVTSPAARGRPQPPRGTGANPERTLTITLSEGGRVAVQADPRWVSQRTAAQLSDALSVALAAARRNLAAEREAAAGGAAGGVRAEQLMMESLAALGNVVRPRQA